MNNSSEDTLGPYFLRWSRSYSCNCAQYQYDSKLFAADESDEVCELTRTLMDKSLVENTL